QGGSKLTPERLVQAQGLLDQGRKVSRSLARNWEGSRARCTRPLMMAGSNRALKKEVSLSCAALTKSQRSEADAQAPLGVGTTRSLERVMAAMGKLDGAPIEFELVDDVPQGGSAVRVAGLAGLWAVAAHAGGLQFAGGLLPAGELLFGSGISGFGTCGLAGVVAIGAAWRVGKAAGLGSDTGSADVAGQAGAVVPAPGAGATLEPDPVAGVDGRQRRERGHGVCGGARSSVSREVDEVAPAVGGAGAVVFAGHHRLLGQRDGRTAIFRGDPTGGSGNVERAAPEH